MKYVTLLLLSGFFILLALVGASLWKYNAISITGLELDTIEKIVSIGTTVPTLIVALLLYRRFSASQSLTDRQTKEVMDLLDRISEMTIVVTPVMYDKDFFHHFTMTDIRLKDFAIVKESFRDYAKERYKDYAYYAEPNLHEVTEYLMYLNSSLYLPKDIAKKLELHFSTGTYWWEGEVKKKRKNKAFDVDIMTRKYFNTRKQPLDPDRVTCINIFALSEGLQDVYDTSVKWVKKNNPDMFRRLNIEMFD